MSRVPKAKGRHLEVNDGKYDAHIKDSAPKGAPTKGMQDHQKSIMQPEAPWKAMPNLGAMPMASPGQGRTFSLEQAMKGNDSKAFQDPQLTDQDEFAGFGGFLDTGLTQIAQKTFPQAMPKEPVTLGSSVGGFPTNPDVGDGYGGILNVTGSKEFTPGYGEEMGEEEIGGGKGKKPGRK